MRTLSVFNFISLNGFYKGPNGDFSWHRHGEEENDFSKEGANSGSTLLFGRITYDVMTSYWPTPMAMQNDPIVAQGMNNAEKIVFSKTMTKADWNNTRIISSNIEEEVQKLKQMPGVGMTILGSGSIVTQLTDAGLIDQYQIMIDPIALGDGTPAFKGIHKKLELNLISHRVFKSGVILATYEPVK